MTVSQAIFLSYASQDADVARRICDALRADGLEVWFDQSELRGGDAWDASIRKQIKECALFVPIISANTQAREEGYFRLEWKLAVDRSHLMADNKAFFFPVVIDGTSDIAANVPDKFRERQWTRIDSAGSIESLAKRIKSVFEKTDTLSPRSAASPATNTSSSRATALSWKTRVAVPAVLAVVGIAAGGVLFWPALRSMGGSTTSAAIQTNSEEARRLTQQALAILTGPAALSAQLDAASGLMDRAVTLDPSSADVLGVAAQVDLRYVGRYVRSDERVEKARSRADKSIAIDPKGYEPRLAQALFLVHAAGMPTAEKAEPALLVLKAERPGDFRPHAALIKLRQNQGRFEEVFALQDEGAAYPDQAADLLVNKAWALTGLGRIAEGEAALDRSIAARPDASNLALKMFLQASWHGDLAGATATAGKMPAAALLDDVGLVATLMLYQWRREPEKMIAVLAPVTREWLIWSFHSPKTAIIGEAHAMMGRKDAARGEWMRALRSVDERLASSPNNRSALQLKAYLQAALGNATAARRTWAHATSIPASGFPLIRFETIHRIGTPDEILNELEARADAMHASKSRGLQRTFISAADLRLNPAWDAVRGSPRFKALQAKLDKDPRFSPTAANQ